MNEDVAQCRYCGRTVLFGSPHPVTGCPVLLKEHEKRLELLEAQRLAVGGEA